MKVVEIFDEVARQMKADLEKARKAVEHPGLKGEAFEKVLRAFLREYLPKSLDLSTGVFIDANGNHSSQIDVIISDAAKTPIFFRSGEIRVIPIECAYAAIEVKAHLDADELGRIFENMKSVRRLQKKAYYKPRGEITYTENLYGKKWEIWPINYFVFALDSIELTRLASSIDKRHHSAGLPEWERIDTVCVLSKGVICNRLASGKFGALPEPNSSLVPCETDRALLLFYTLISHYLNQARLPNFRFTDYLGLMSF